MENKPGKPNNPVRRPVVRPITRPMGSPRPKTAAPTSETEKPEPRIRAPRPPRIKTESNVDGVKILLIVLVILLGAATAYLAFDKFRRPSAPVAIEEADEKPDPSTLMKSDIDQKVAEINKLEDSIRVIIAQKEALGQELSNERAKIDELEGLKNQIRNKELSINSLNKKLFLFKKEFQTAQDSMTFLISENKRLSAENGTLSESLKSKDDSLKTMDAVKSKLTEKVAMAAGLKAENFSVTALTPSGKEIKPATSYKAMTVGGLKVGFAISENNVAEHGSKDIYFRLLEPSGATLQNDEKNFIVNGRNISYTDKQSFEFNNSEHILSFLYNKVGKFKPGRYTMEFYSDGNKIGSTYVTLAK